MRTTFAFPPIALGLEGISASTKGPVHIGDTIDFEYNAMNYGFSDTPAVYLCILSRLQSKPSQFLELAYEDLKYQASIKTKTDRIVQVSLTVKGESGICIFFNSCYIGTPQVTNASFILPDGWRL